MVNSDRIINSCDELFREILKWVGLSLIMGIPIGLLVGFFNKILSLANNFRGENNFLVYFLPIAGLIICYMYLKTRRNAYSGENLLKSEVQSAAKDIPFYMMFVVFIGSLLTTFFGGSAGKESSGVAMGGTLGDFIAKKLNLKDEEQRTLVIIGVGSGFGVLYDVPFAGAILGMELVLKGNFHYEALIPAFLTSTIANKVASLIGNQTIEYPQLDLGPLTILLILKLVALGILFGLVAMLFNFVLDNSGKVYNIFTKNPYLKAIIGGILTIILFWIAGDNYNGLGQKFINHSFEVAVSPVEFLWKILFTAVALGSVFQGGRGNPTLFVGATFGSAIAGIFGLPVASVAALGMVGVFSGAVALPITGVAMAIEYFGASEVMAIIIIMTLSYTTSGFYDILTSRKLTKGKSTLFKGVSKGK
ncbi:MAG: chloride channel protein [Clostridium sp.]